MHEARAPTVEPLIFFTKKYIAYIASNVINTEPTFIQRKYHLILSRTLLECKMREVDQGILELHY